MKLSLPDLAADQGKELHVAGRCTLSPSDIARLVGEQAPPVLRPTEGAEGLLFGLKYKRRGTAHGLAVFLRNDERPGHDYAFDLSLTTTDPLLPSVIGPSQAGAPVFEAERVTQRLAATLIQAVSGGLVASTVTVCGHFEWPISGYPTLEGIFPSPGDPPEEAVAVTDVTIRLPGGLRLSTGLLADRLGHAYVHLSRPFSSDDSLLDLTALWAVQRDTTWAVLRQEVG